MNSSRIMITGCNGQLGLALQKKYPEAQAYDAKELDICSAETLENYDWSDTDVIINAAAYTNVDGAETPEGRKLAWKTNALAAANLASIAIRHSLVLVHISTDYIFDGIRGNHKEEDSPSPINTYGASKAAGDVAIGLSPKHYILRTSWVIGEGKNFVKTMLEIGRKGVNPTVVADQVGRPTFTPELVRAIDHLLDNQCEYGTYNVTNGGQPVSWARLARTIFELAGLDVAVHSITTPEYVADKPHSAPRPLNSVLCLKKLESTGFKLTDWEEDLKDYINKEDK